MKQKILGNTEDFFINQIVKPKGILRNFSKTEKNRSMKLINLEHFYREVLN